MPASVIAERVGWFGSASWFWKRVALLRPEYDRRIQRTDWRTCRAIKRSASFGSRSGRAGRASAGVWWWCPRSHSSSPSGWCPRGPHLTSARDVVAAVGAARRDPEAAAVGQRDWDRPPRQAGRRRRRVLRDLATRLVQLKPFLDPQSKGVERGTVSSRPRSCPGARSPPGRLQCTVDEPAAHTQPAAVRALRARPINLLEQDRAAMLALPPVAPSTAHRARIRLGRDYFVAAPAATTSADPETSPDHLLRRLPATGRHVGAARRGGQPE
jgi:hypothetical protein